MRSSSSVNVGREAEGHELSQRWDSVNGRPVIDRAGTARLVMRDTAPAVSPGEDADGYALPDALLVFVIDATKADKAVNAERWRKLVRDGATLQSVAPKPRTASCRSPTALPEGCCA